MSALQDLFKTGKFAVVPVRLLAGLPGRQQLVLLHLWGHRNINTLDCFPKVETLATECDLTPQTVKQTLTELELAGWLQRVHRFRHDGGQTTSQYDLMIEPGERMEPRSIIVEDEDPDGDFCFVEDPQVSGGTEKYTTGGYGKTVPGPVKGSSIYTTPRLPQGTSKEESNNARSREGFLPLPEAPRKTTPLDIVTRWNETAARCGFPRVRLPLSPKMSRLATARLRDVQPDEWSQFWSALERQTYLADKGWFDFEFCFRSIENIAKVCREWDKWILEKADKEKAKTEPRRYRTIREWKEDMTKIHGHVPDKIPEYLRKEALDACRGVGPRQRYRSLREWELDMLDVRGSIPDDVPDYLRKQAEAEEAREEFA